ncbi:helix-turn-helix transcriptional regulator [Photobacterium rosenbergii]|uniref:Helix-turn-helix transcriptional regulator n=1 Tax=Photobacterium rosenbergii TaxID=294936 RepID=A0ABU3ZHU9_9GAMM|nr:helix-turn-helix transcriptional regulator [Photobacterium rosenbergii]MDV5169637.1 helix-turn-helix transcriptional regulator [Photobacterium rosenbergii]
MASFNVTDSRYKRRIHSLCSALLEADGHKHDLCDDCSAQNLVFAESLYKYLQHADMNYSGEFLPFEVGQCLAEEDLIENGDRRVSWFQLLTETLAYHITASNYATFHIDFIGERLQIRLERIQRVRVSTKELNSLMIGYLLTLIKQADYAQFQPSSILITSEVEVKIPDIYPYQKSKVGNTAFSINIPVSWLLGYKTSEDPLDSFSLKMIRKKCRENLSNPKWNINQLAKECSLSVRSLQRILANRNTTFRKIMLNEKIDIAKSELTKGNNHRDIAMKLGFTEYSAYSRFFKKMTGTTPREY